MTLQEHQIKEIIKTNPAKTLVAAGREYNKTMRLHLYGDGLKAHLTTIEGFEKPAVQELRAKYSKSNKDLMARLMRPIDKVFSARGGSIYYNLQGDQEKRAMALSGDVKGMSVKKWIESKWKPHYLDDPAGVLFIELDADGKAYPTYKSISNIYDYCIEGNTVEYIVFVVSPDEKKQWGLSGEDKYYRVVDDAADYLVRESGEEIIIMQDLTYANFFGRVPAMLNSDIQSPAQAGVISLFDEVVSLADQYLLKSSIKLTHDFLHAYPKYWEFADSCTPCAGTGHINAEPCSTCKGSGRSTMGKVSDVKLLAFPDKDNPSVAPNVAGYVSPDKTYHDIATAELAALEAAMDYTLWGSSETGRAGGMSTDGEKTATEVITDQQPKIDRLSMIADAAEKRHKFIVDSIIEVSVQEGYQSKGGSSVNYGRRFMIEGPDAVWNRYEHARTVGAPAAVLDDLLIEFIETKYSGDPVNLAIQMKLMSVEPFVHNTVTEVKDYPCTPFEKQRKAYYSDWLGTMKPVDLLGTDIENLKTNLSEFVVKQSTSNEGNKDETPLAEKLNVGTLQALKELLADPVIQPEQKKQMMIHIFGIKEDVAKLMVGDKAVTTTIDKKTDVLPE